MRVRDKIERERWSGLRSNVRVRYAPSPTGEPHVGNLRTALFNWLFARRYGGRFIVRVEDTDRERYVDEAVGTILESLRWLGLDWDEGPEVEGEYGPYFQSLRLHHYQSAALALIDKGYAYHCYCSRERLDEVRKEQQRRKLTTGYDRHCIDLPAQDRRQREAEGTVPVVRFKMPLSGTTSVDDLIRGEVTWQNDQIDDFILLKSDGYPTYHLANVLDDHLMEISHVLRAEEWLSSVPRHLQIYCALGYDPPLFAHLPMILGPDRAKLSKRHGATSLLGYRDEGFLPEAMVNFMVLLGWSLDDKTDVMSRDMVVEHFSLERIGKPGAIFDREKLVWMNGVYIRQLSHTELAHRMAPYLDSERGSVDRGYLMRIVPLVQERLKTLDDTRELTDYFFLDELVFDPALLIQKGMDADATVRALKCSVRVLEQLREFDVASLEEALRSLAGELGLTGRQLFGALRVATTGKTAAPPLFETMEVLERERCVARIDAAAERLEVRD